MDRFNKILIIVLVVLISFAVYFMHKVGTQKVRYIDNDSTKETLIIECKYIGGYTDTIQFYGYRSCLKIVDYRGSYTLVHDKIENIFESNDVEKGVVKFRILN